MEIDTIKTQSEWHKDVNIINNEFDLLRAELMSEVLIGALSKCDFQENERLLKANKDLKIKALTPSEPFRLLRFLNEP